MGATAAGIITDEMRANYRVNRLKKLQAAEKETFRRVGSQSEELAKLDKLIPGYIESLKDAAMNQFGRGGRVGEVALSFQHGDIARLFIDHPLYVFKVEEGLRALEPKTSRVYTQRCRYKYAQRSGVDTRPAMQLIAEFSPSLT